MERPFIWLMFFLISLNTGAQHIWQIERHQDSIKILKNGYPLLPFSITEVAAFSEGKTWISLGGKYAYIDTSGTLLTDTLYDVVFPFHEGFAVVGKDTLFGVIDSLGQEIAAPYYDWIEPFQNRFAVIKKDGYWGLMDSTGYEWYEPAADEALIRMEQNRWAIKYRGKWGVLDHKAVILHPFKYDAILKDGTAWENGKKLKLE